MYIGVREQEKGRFRARVSLYHKIISIGSYGSPEEAAIARDRFVIENKLNRKLNFPNYKGFK